MKRARIEEILREAEHNMSRYGSGGDSYKTPEVSELCDLALRATEPDMVMVPREECKFLVDNYLANAGTQHEFVSCITPTGMDNKYGRAWKALYAAVAAAQENQP